MAESTCASLVVVGTSAGNNTFLGITDKEVALRCTSKTAKSLADTYEESKTMAHEMIMDPDFRLEATSGDAEFWQGCGDNEVYYEQRLRLYLEQRETDEILFNIPGYGGDLVGAARSFFCCGVRNKAPFCHDNEMLKCYCNKDGQNSSSSSITRIAIRITMYIMEDGPPIFKVVARREQPGMAERTVHFSSTCVVGDTLTAGNGGARKRRRRFWPRLVSVESRDANDPLCAMVVYEDYDFALFE